MPKDKFNFAKSYKDLQAIVDWFKKKMSISKIGLPSLKKGQNL
jgi:hypothetical protein